MNGQWPGIYQGVVHGSADPAGQLRVRLLVPQVLETAVSNWAVPVGATSATAPGAGTSVMVMFLGGDINYPVYFMPIVVE